MAERWAGGPKVASSSLAVPTMNQISAKRNTVHGHVPYGEAILVHDIHK